VANLDRREVATICLGGAAGATLRVWLAQTFAAGASSWPWAIFAINLTGSFALACVATLINERRPFPAYVGPLLGIGFCGAYTTFSTMAIEIVQMLEVDRWGLAVGYGCASIAAGYLAIWAGSASVRRVLA
jgi:CrcB protein